MSFKIKKTKKYEIASIPGGDESVITNIRDVKEIRNRVNEEVVGGTEGKTYALTETYFDYTIYFNADLRKALMSGYSIARVSVRTKLSDSNYQLFDKVDPDNLRTLLSALYGKGRDNTREMVISDRDGILSRKFVNIVHGINSFRIKNAEKLNDRQLFGVVSKTVFVDPGTFKKRGGNLQLAQKNITVINSDLVDAGDFFSLVYEEMIVQGHDPSKTVLSFKSETPSDKRLEGCFVKPNVMSGNIVYDSLVTSAMSKYAGYSRDINHIDDSIDNFRDGDLLAVNRDVPNRVRLFSHKCSIPKSQCSGMQNLWLVIDLINKDGLIGQTVKKRINHRQNIEDYYSPKSDVIGKISTSSGSPSNSLRLTVTKDDPNIVACRVFYRSLKETAPLEAFPFGDGTEIKFKYIVETEVDEPNQQLHHIRSSRKTSTMTKKTRTYLPKHSGTATMMRVVPVSKVGVVYGNFTSSTIKKGPWIPYRSSVCTFPTKDAITIILHSASPDVIGVTFERRDITKNEKTFKPVVRNTSKSVNDPHVYDSSKKSASIGRLPVKTFSTIDENVVHGRMYEYRARLELKYGVRKYSQITRFEKFSRKMELINVEIQQPKVDGNSNKKSTPTEYPSLTSLTISFNVNFTMGSTDTTKILEALESAGLSDLYTDELLEIKSQLNNLIFFDVSRFNLFTGKTAYLGTFPQGTLIVDDGIQTNALAPVTGQMYQYRAEAMLVAPKEAVDEIVAQANDPTYPVVQQTIDIFNPSTLVTLRERAVTQSQMESGVGTMAVKKYSLDKADKNYSESSLSGGTLSSVASAASVGRSVLSRFPTGDMDQITVTTTQNPNVTSQSVTFGSRHTGPILRWQVGSNSYTSVDFFIVFAKKQGRKTIVGKCHSLKSGNITYIDRVNKGYVGRIEYSIAPVFYSGTLGSDISIGAITIPDRNTKFRRSN